MELNEELCVDISQICYNIYFLICMRGKEYFFPVALMILICNICISEQTFTFPDMKMNAALAVPTAPLS